jgi:endo-1,4-beta-D-glucanase Y
MPPGDGSTSGAFWVKNPEMRRGVWLAFGLLALTASGGCSNAPDGSTGSTGARGGSGGATTGGSGGSGGAAGGTLGGNGGASGGTGGGTGGAAGSLAAGTGGATGGGAGASAGSAGAGAGDPVGGSGGAAGASAAGAGAGGGGAGDAGSAGKGGAGPTVTIPRGGRCMPPTNAKLADAQAAYDKWKTDLVISEGANGALRVRRPNSSGAQVNSTVSEGIAYGMLASVYMNDQTTFDQLWKYAAQWLDENGLMHWYINAEGTMPLGTGAASDGDEDMAFAFLIADKKWGGGGSLGDSYATLANRLIQAIWDHEIDHGRNDVLTPGDGFADGSIINISYFAPAFFRAFGRATGDTAEWNRVVDSSYAATFAALNAANGNQNNGLVPAWSTPAGVPTVPPNTSHPIHHQLDSCRTPFRIAQDYCWNGEPRALEYLEKINSFHNSVGALNIVDGYDLDGTPHPQFASVGNQSAAFVGPAAAAAMAQPMYSMFRDQAYDAVATLTLFAGSQYYNESWTVLSIIMMTGIMDDLTLPP